MSAPEATLLIVEVAIRRVADRMQFEYEQNGAPLNLALHAALKDIANEIAKETNERRRAEWNARHDEPKK